MKTIAKTRIEKELKMFSSSPTPGISCSCNDENSLHNLTGVIIGAPGTPFENGLFTLDIQIPERYPFEPPCVQFVTPVYHPNIDSKGRICLDTLKLPPQGSWKPHLNLSTVLMMIRVLLGEPGDEDPLMANIWQEFKYDYPTYAAKAKQWTKKYARGETLVRDQDSKQTDVVVAIDDGNKESNRRSSDQKPNHFSDDYDHDDDGKSTYVRTPAPTPVLHNDTNIQCPPRKRQLGLKCSKKSDIEEGQGAGRVKKSR